MPITVYVVRRLGWEYGDDFYYRNDSEDAPLRSFLNRDKAEAHRRDLDWAYVVEHKVNPFGWIDARLQDRSLLPLDELLARLRAAGIADPEADAWTQYESLPESGRRAVWDVIDRIRFHEVIEMKVEVEGTT